MTCPNCHAEISSDATFCGNCGSKLNTQSQFVPGVAPTSAPSPSPAAPSPPAGPNPVFGNQFQSPQPAPAPAPLPSTYQPAYSGGAVVSQHITPAAPPAQVTGQSHSDTLAIAAFVLGVLGCVGWIIPIVGVVLGLLALIFGTMSFKSRRRIFAIIGTVLAVPVLGVSIFIWVRNVQHILKSHSSPVSGLTAPGTSSSSQTVATDCYTVKIPASLTLTHADGSCTFSAANSSSGEQYEVKVLQVPQLSAANLAQAAQADASNAINATPGAQILTQQSTTFVGSPAYTVTFKASDGSAGTLGYVLDSTAQGNLVIVAHVEQSGKNYDLSQIAKDWSW